MRRRLRLLLFSMPLLVGVGAAAQESSLELRMDAVKDFKTYFRRTRDVAERVEAIMTLNGNECIPAALELVRLLVHESEPIRKTAMAVISNYRDVKTFQGLIDELPDMKEQAKRALLIEVLGRAGIQQALPVICDIALHDKRADVHVKVRIAEAIGKLGDAENSLAVLSKFLTDSDATVRITTADTIGKLKIRAIGDELVPLLGDKYWQVRAAARLPPGTAAP